MAFFVVRNEIMIKRRSGVELGRVGSSSRGEESNEKKKTFGNLTCVCIFILLSPGDLSENTVM